MTKHISKVFVENVKSGWRISNVSISKTLLGQIALASMIAGDNEGLGITFYCFHISLDPVADVVNCAPVSAFSIYSLAVPVARAAYCCIGVGVCLDGCKAGAIEGFDKSCVSYTAFGAKVDSECFGSFDGGVFGDSLSVFHLIGRPCTFRVWGYVKSLLANPIIECGTIGISAFWVQSDTCNVLLNFTVVLARFLYDANLRRRDGKDLLPVGFYRLGSGGDRSDGGERQDGQE